ncbi:hypothetical protein KFK09_011018 [Dendrobium nobile]|uniref:Cytochrome P450 n=1 Tax=Dendrobium nobile TaxID=94219 RepID=A0A8T3BDQ7_DENNO|nr:hypothetical protein KFK09_011018 [Dendrobium nobile]
MSLFLPILIILSIFLLLKAVYSYLWLPHQIQLHFRRQGIGGPPRRLLSGGNAGEIRRLFATAQSSPTTGLSHDVDGRAAPHYAHWSARYGRSFLYWFGSQPRLAIGDPTAVRAAMTDTSGAIDKLGFVPTSRDLFGEGLVGLTGEKWARHRRIVGPAFSMETVKSWIPEISIRAANMLHKWEMQLGKNSEFEIDIHKECHKFSADVISSVAFGSNYEEGKRIFELQEELLPLVSIALRSVYIPGFRFIPTTKNRKRWRLNKEIQDSLQRLIHINGQKCENSKNFLGLLISANKKEGKDQIGTQEIIDECKTFYFAGKETTANVLTWSILLLAIHQDWQIKAREEVTSICSRDRYPEIEDLNRFKLVSMILKETMRLYSPAVLFNRVTTKDVKLSRINIPAGTLLYMPVISIHHDSELWGPDVNEFNPLRFSNVDKGDNPAAFFPFGLGQRICVGQNLALVELKVALSMILQRFEFELSPSYVHSPRLLLTLEPQYGVQVLLRKI